MGRQGIDHVIGRPEDTVGARTPELVLCRGVGIDRVELLRECDADRTGELVEGASRINQCRGRRDDGRRRGVVAVALELVGPDVDIARLEVELHRIHVGQARLAIVL